MNRTLRNLLALAVIILIAASCQYKFIVEPVIIPPDPSDTISFSDTIEPIWTDQGCTGCHPGTVQPDLTTGNAYASITGMGLVNTDVPADSKIYYYPLPDGSHYAKYTEGQASLILIWIEQGALDN